MKRQFSQFLEKISQYNRLVSDYKKAVDQSPDHALAHVNWAIDLAMDGRMDEALLKFEQAAALAPNRAEVFTNWGVALARVNRLDEAIARFETAVSLSPEAAGNYVLWGAVLMEQAQLDQAAEKYQKAIELAPQNPEPYVNWGIAMARTGDYFGAVKQFKTAIAMNAAQPHVYFLWGAVLAELGDYATAIEKFRITLRFLPGHAEAYYFWSVCLNRTGRYEEALDKSKKALQLYDDADQARAEAHLNQGDILANLNRWELAIENYKETLRLDDTSGEALLSWGKALCKQGHYEEGLRQLDAAAGCNPNLPGLAKAYGQFLLEQGQAESALPYLEKAHREQPAEVDVLLNWALALIKTDQMPLAMDKLRQIESQDRWNPQMHYLLGTYYMGAGAYGEAAAHFEKALAEKPDFDDAAINLSLVLCELGRSEEAVRSLRPVFRKNSQDARIHFIYGTVLFSAGDYKEAIQKLTRALALDPGDPRPYLGLGEVYLKMQDDARAEEALTAFLLREPESVPGLFLTGILALRLGQHQKAALAWDTLLSLAPGHLECQCYRARVAGILEGPAAMQARFESALAGQEAHPLGQALIKLAWADAIETVEPASPETQDLMQGMRKQARALAAEAEDYRKRHWLSFEAQPGETR